MSDETRRPGNASAGGAPIGMRARNRTTVLGPERIDNLRTTLDRPAAAEPPMAEESADESVDASALDIFGGGDSVGATSDAPDAFQTLDEIFGGRQDDNTTQDGGNTNNDFNDPFDFDSVLSADSQPSEPPHFAPSDDNKDAFSPAVERRGGAPLSQPKVVRSTASMKSIPAVQQQSNEDEVFDPFAAIQEEPVATEPGSQQTQAGGIDDLDDMFGGIGEIPVAETTASGPPKIVRPGDVGAAHERVIIPPPPPPAAPIHTPHPASVAAPVQPQQTHKEAESMPETRDAIYWKTESPLVGFLVTYDHDPKGSYVELRQGRLMVSNAREESGSCLVVLGESISPMHAIMRVGPAGVVQVLDQLSESGTRVKHMGQTEEEFLSGEKSSVSHGDIIFFGDRKFHVLLVVGEEDVAE